MALSMYEASVPVFTQMLVALQGVLDKAEAHATARKIDPAVFLQARLFPDMFPLLRQVQVAADFAKGCGARLAGAEVPSYVDDETTFAGLRARIKKTIDFLASLNPADFDGSGEREVSLRFAGEQRTFKGQPYLLAVAQPNFYFHATIAYAILRHNGVDVGKGDFPGLGLPR